MKLESFSMPPGFRGRPAWFVQLWWLCESIFFRTSPQVMYGYRRWLLRIFGAKIGKGVIIRPTVRVTYPWKLEVGDFSWIGDDVNLYTLGKISIGSNSVVSQKSYLCAADHDHDSPAFDIRQRPITVGDGVWLCADVFVGPGVSIGSGAIVGARSSVFRDLPANTVCMGTPANVIKVRENCRENTNFRP